MISATREAVERARRGDGPTLVEALTFRMGGHSSSDDPTRYRDAALVSDWERQDPVARLRAWMRSQGLASESDEEQWTKEYDETIAVAVREAEALPPPSIETMFTDVYQHMPRHIEEQMKHAVALGAGTKFEGAFPL